MKRQIYIHHHSSLLAADFLLCYFIRTENTAKTHVSRQCGQAFRVKHRWISVKLL